MPLINALLPYAKWGLLLYAVFGLWVTQRVGARWMRTHGKTEAAQESTGARWFSYFIVYTLFTFLSMGVLLLPVAIGERVSVFFTGQAYDAKVVSVNSRMERVTRKDSDDRSYTESVMMHTPVYGFTQDDGTAREVTGDVKSESAPFVGEMQTIFYEPRTGRMVTASFGNVLMLSFGALFAFFSILAFYATLRYAFGGSTEGVVSLMARTLMGFVLPLAMGLMAVGLGVYAYGRFEGGRNEDDPAFLGVLAGFFAVVMLFACVGYVRQRWAEKSD